MTKFSFRTPKDLWPNRDERVAKAAQYAADAINTRLTKEIGPDRGPVQIRVCTTDQFPVSILLDALVSLSEDLRKSGWRLVVRAPNRSFAQDIEITLSPLAGTE